jgi:predicted ester cyclase
MRFLCGLLVALAAYQPSLARTLLNDGRKQSVETKAAQHKAVFRHYVTIWERGALNELSNVLTANYVGHSASGSRDLDGLRERISQFHKLYPDAHFVIEDQVAEGDEVATRMTATATSSATGKPVKLVGLNVSRFMDGRIAEEWPVWETVP